MLGARNLTSASEVIELEGKPTTTTLLNQKKFLTTIQKFVLIQTVKCSIHSL